MGSSSDFPITPWLRNQIAADARDLAAGREPWSEEVYLAERRAARAASRRKRLMLADYETPIASENDRDEVKW